MPTRRAWRLWLLLLGCWTLAGSALATPGAATEDVERVIVKWRDASADTATLDARVHGLADRAGAPLQRLRGLGGGMHVVRLDGPRHGAPLQALLARLRSDPRVQFVEPDRRVHAHAFTPNDPLFTGQWYLQSVQPAAIQAINAWDISKGGASAATSPVVVAVIDTGVRFEHPDLRRAADGGKLLPGYDFISADSPGVYATANDGDGWDADPSDPGDYMTAADLASSLYASKKCGGGTNHDQPTPSSWHGTRVSGMLAADTDNAAGIAGAGFNIRVLPARVLGKCGGYDSDVIAAMYWSAGLLIPASLLAGAPPVNSTPARVLNLSLGSTGSCSAAYQQAANDVTAHGVLVVASAGNEGGPIDAPANCSGVLAVTGARHIGTKVGYSNLGAEAGIAAPAGNCINTVTGSACLYSLDTTTDSGTQGPVSSTYTDQFNSNVGTSFAAPLVSATAGLMLAVNPYLTPAQLIARIKATAAPFATQSDSSPQPPYCHVPTGSSDLQADECICTTAACGAGLLNAGTAVADAQRPSALATVRGTVAVGQPLTLDGSASGASQGRSIASYSWSVVSISGGASTPAFADAASATTSILSPTRGSVTVRLWVTDNTGASDSVDLVVNAATSGGTVGSSAAPPSGAGGGGGALGPELLLLAGALLLRLRRPGAASRSRA